MTSQTAMGKRGEKTWKNRDGTQLLWKPCSHPLTLNHASGDRQKHVLSVWLLWKPSAAHDTHTAHCCWQLHSMEILNITRITADADTTSFHISIVSVQGRNNYGWNGSDRQQKKITACPIHSRGFFAHQIRFPCWKMEGGNIYGIYFIKAFVVLESHKTI